MERPKPTKSLIASVFGSDRGLIEKVYCGLDEVPLLRVAGVLNLEDIFSIAAGCRIEREEDLRRRRDNERERFIPYVGIMDLYDIARIAQKSASERRFPWMNSLRGKMTKSQFDLYQMLNPFDRNLENRMALIDERDVEEIKKALSGIVYNYVTEGQYERMNMQGLGGDPFRRVMDFLPYKKKESTAPKIVACFAKELERKISRYDISTLPEADRYLRQDIKNNPEGAKDTLVESEKSQQLGLVF